VVPATLCGYVLGGVVAYVLIVGTHLKAFSLTLGQASDLLLVALVGFCVTYTIMVLLVDHWRTPYLLAQIVTSLVAMFFNIHAQSTVDFWVRGRILRKVYQRGH